MMERTDTPPPTQGYGHDEFLNDLLENIPEEWDTDEAAEAIAIDYLRHLESEVKRLGGRFYPWADDTPAQGERGEEPMHRYANRDPAALEPYYSWHVQAMTEEGLHAKSAIAAELAFRDAEITALRLNCKVHQRAFREQREVAQDAGEKLFRAREEVAGLRARLGEAEVALRQMRGECMEPSPPSATGQVAEGKQP